MLSSRFESFYVCGVVTLSLLFVVKLGKYIAILIIVYLHGGIGVALYDDKPNVLFVDPRLCLLLNA